MRFEKKWVNLVMDCVPSATWSFIIKGRVYGELFPCRGLRQEIPLSPYFFILVADVFSLMLQNKVKERKLHRVKVSYRGPETLHLLFADDSLLFDRASRSNAHELMY